MLTGLIILALVVVFIVWRTWRNWNKLDDDSSGVLIRCAFKVIALALLGYYAVPAFRMGGVPAAIAMLLTAPVLFLLARLWGRQLLGLILTPVSDVFDGGSEPPEARAALSIPQARRIQGRYDEAIAVLGDELERHPMDFEGQMLLAEILVENKGDFEAGLAVLEGILAQKVHPSNRHAFVLNTLADWQLKLRSDPEAARAALQRIVTLFPDSVLAHKATQRLAHLPTRQAMAERAAPRKFTLTHVEDYIQPGGRSGHVEAPRERLPEELAEELIDRLRQEPDDAEARELLGLVYADDLGRLDWGVAQLQQLVNQQGQPEREVIRLLELMASVQRRHGDPPGARGTYQQIVDRFPGSAAAQRATRAIFTLQG